MPATRLLTYDSLVRGLVRGMRPGTVCPLYRVHCAQLPLGTARARHGTTQTILRPSRPAPGRAAPRCCRCPSRGSPRPRGLSALLPADLPAAVPRTPRRLAAETTRRTFACPAPHPGRHAATAATDSPPACNPTIRLVRNLLSELSRLQNVQRCAQEANSSRGNRCLSELFTEVDMRNRALCATAREADA